MCVTVGNRTLWERSGGRWTRVMTAIATIWAADGERWVPNPLLSPSIASNIYNIPYGHRASKLSGMVLYPAAQLGSAAFSHGCCHRLPKAKGRDLPWPQPPTQGTRIVAFHLPVESQCGAVLFPVRIHAGTGFSPAGSRHLPLCWSIALSFLRKTQRKHCHCLTVGSSFLIAVWSHVWHGSCYDNYFFID